MATPLSVLTAYLQQAKTLSLSSASELQVCIEQALDLVLAIDSYLVEATTKESPELAAIAQKTLVEPWQERASAGKTRNSLKAEMQSDPVQGQFLKMLVHISKATKVLEIGMFTGYATLAIAEALPQNGQVIACEIDPYLVEFANSLLQKSCHYYKIQIEVGDAKITLPKLAEQGYSFDLIFLDADKKGYLNYYELILEQGLLSPQGVICVDNTLFKGTVCSPNQRQSGISRAIASFNQFVANDPRVEQVMLPLRDGITLIRRI